MNSKAVHRVRSAVFVLIVLTVCLTVGLLSADDANASDASIVLPSWFEENRVQAHSEHDLEHALRMTPEAQAKVIRSLGANVLTRILLHGWEGAWWPSKVGEISALIGDRDFAAEIVRAVHGEGMKVIAYHRHMSDAAMQAQHPDWVCRHPDGSPVIEPRGRHMKTEDIFVLCLNSPYRQYIQTRLIELADRGVDCLYFDSWHMPDVCACDYCKQAFRKEMGHELDLSALVGSPTYMEGVEFVNRTMVRTFSQWHKAVRARHPHVLFAIGSSKYPRFISPHIDSALLAISDTSKTEFPMPFGGNPNVMAKDPDFAIPAYDDQVALGWSIVRDGSGGRPPLMWIPWIRSETAALYSTAAAVTYGCIASLDMSFIRRLDDRTATTLKRRFASSFDMGGKISPHLAYTRPVFWAALHVSERARNGRWPDQKRMWREVFSPTLGAFQVLKEAHLPFATLTDAGLRRGLAGETRVLVLPWPDELDATQKMVVASFEKDGGLVVRMAPTAGWYKQADKPRLRQEMLRAIQQYEEAPPIRIMGPKAMHAVCHRNPEASSPSPKGLGPPNSYVVCLANRWGWFRSTMRPSIKLNEDTEPPPCAGVKIDFSSSLGRPVKVLEVLTGKTLRLETSTDGTRISVPPFQIMACVVAEF